MKGEELVRILDSELPTASLGQKFKLAASCKSRSDTGQSDCHQSVWRRQGELQVLALSSSAEVSLG